MTKKETKRLIIASISATLFIVTIIVAGNQLSKPKNPNPPEIKTWNVPIYMLENLKYMLDDFNRRFDEKIKYYREELRNRYPEFKNMPDDVILDLEHGIFVKREDYQKLQAENTQPIEKEGRDKNEKKDN